MGNTSGKHTIFGFCRDFSEIHFGKNSIDIFLILREREMCFAQKNNLKSELVTNLSFHRMICKCLSEISVEWYFGSKIVHQPLNGTLI